MSSIAYGIFNIVTSEMVTDLNSTGNCKRIFTKHKITTSETDKILLSEKGTHKEMRRYSDSNSPFLPPTYTSNKSTTLQSPTKTHLNNINDIKSSQLPQDDTLIQNVTTLPESRAKVFIKIKSS